MIDPEVRQQAIDATAAVLQSASPGISDEDARGAATYLIDREIKKRGGSDAAGD